MQDESGEKSSFKVVDKRATSSTNTESVVNAVPPKNTAQDSIQSEAKGTPNALPRPAMSFSLFIQTLAHQAMMGLGMVAWPDSGLIRIDLTLAKETIDILDILQKKSAGNLDADEQALIDTIVYQLKVIFVEQTKGTPNGPSSFVG